MHLCGAQMQRLAVDVVFPPYLFWGWEVSLSLELPAWLAPKPQGSSYLHLSSARITGVQVYSAICVLF